MATLIKELIQQLAPGSIIEMFELDIRPITGTDLPGDRSYFHDGTNRLNQPIVWQGTAYQSYPIKAEGFEMTSKGTLPRPSLQVANVSGIITALCLQHDDIVGAKVRRRRTFARYLDAVNFPGGVNADADPTQELPEEVFYVERKVSENKLTVTWELASALDLEGFMLPARTINGTTCSWRYRSAECSYAGTNYFDINDNSVAALSQDICSKSVKGCKRRFGERGILPFGGFPAARVYRY